MKRGLIASVVFLCMATAPLSAADPVLWYRHPAQKWGDALPVGNGRLGGMVFGGIAKERIQLNEDTIWNGKKRDRVNPEALKALPEVRRLLFEGKPKEAEALEDQKMMGIPNRQPPYQPLGDLNIEFSGHDNADGLPPRVESRDRHRASDVSHRRCGLHARSVLLRSGPGAGGPPHLRQARPVVVSRNADAFAGQPDHGSRARSRDPARRGDCPHRISGSLRT